MLSINVLYNSFPWTSAWLTWLRYTIKRSGLQKDQQFQWYRKSMFNYPVRQAATRTIYMPMFYTGVYSELTWYSVPSYRSIPSLGRKCPNSSSDVVSRSHWRVTSLIILMLCYHKKQQTNKGKRKRKERKKKRTKQNSNTNTVTVTYL